MAIEIGSKGLQEVNLTIPQGTSLTFDVKHKDEDGHAVDHSQSTAKMAFKGSETIQLDTCCACGATGVSVAIPASMTVDMPLGKMNWDMMVTTSQGEVIRMAYGKVSIIDTYANDAANGGE